MMELRDIVENREQLREELVRLVAFLSKRSWRMRTRRRHSLPDLMHLNYRPVARHRQLNTFTRNTKVKVVITVAHCTQTLPGNRQPPRLQLRKKLRNLYSAISLHAKHRVRWEQNGNTQFFPKTQDPTKHITVLLCSVHKVGQKASLSISAITLSSANQFH